MKFNEIDWLESLSERSLAESRPDNGLSIIVFISMYMENVVCQVSTLVFM